jgi:hypothetical protein
LSEKQSDGGCAIAVGFKKFENGREFYSEGWRARYFGVCTRTIKRWEEQRKVSPPDIEINGKKYISKGTIEKDEANLKAATAAKSRHENGRHPRG